MVTEPPNLIGDLPGCSFARRRPFAAAPCETERPGETVVGTDHRAACHRLGDIKKLRPLAREKSTWRSSKSAA